MLVLLPKCHDIHGKYNLIVLLSIFQWFCTDVVYRCIELMHQNRVGLKGPLATPVGKGHRSLNLAVRR